MNRFLAWSFSFEHSGFEVLQFISYKFYTREVISSFGALVDDFELIELNCVRRLNSSNFNLVYRYN